MVSIANVVANISCSSAGLSCTARTIVTCEGKDTMVASDGVIWDTHKYPDIYLSSRFYFEGFKGLFLNNSPDIIYHNQISKKEKKQQTNKKNPNTVKNCVEAN